MLFSALTNFTISIHIIMEPLQGTSPALMNPFLPFRRTDKEDTCSVPNKPIPEEYQFHNWVGDMDENSEECQCCVSIMTAALLSYGYSELVGKSVIFSPQELVDCSGVQCRSGPPEPVLEYLTTKEHYSLRSDYPYTDNFGQCRPVKPPAAARLYRVTAYHQMRPVPAPSEIKFMMFRSLKMPIMTGINLSDDMQLHYKLTAPKIFDGRCDPTALDHSVLVVGWTTLDGKPVWIVQSNDRDFGLRGFGYFRQDGQCGVMLRAWYITLDENH